MAKEKEVNPKDIDASFVISSFKNKERLNNPSSVPRPLLPPEEKEAIAQPETPRFSRMPASPQEAANW